MDLDLLALLAIIIATHILWAIAWRRREARHAVNVAIARRLGQETVVRCAREIAEKRRAHRTAEDIARMATVEPATELEPQPEQETPWGYR